MAPPTFIQESRLGRVIYQIRDGALHISKSRLGGGLEEYRVELQSLDPDYRPRTLRFNFVVGLAGGLFVLSCLALWGLYRQTVVPESVIEFFISWPLYGIVLSLLMAVRFSRRLEYFVFSNQRGEPVFSIIRERAQAAESEAFILTLVSHIELAQSGLSPLEKEHLLKRLAPENAPLALGSQEIAYWKLSLVFGGLATGLPWIPGLAYYFHIFHFMLVFWLCVGGVACGVYSYLKKERGRHWSIVGSLLSFIPPMFY